MSGEAFQLTGYEVLCDDTAGASFNEYNVLHFIAGKQFYSTYVYLTAQCGVCTQQQLLACLAFSVECT
jgi:hypothetical protein